MKHRYWILIATVAAVAACGGGSDNEGVASFGPSSESTTSSAPGLDFEESLLAFTQCLRDHGVDVPDPEFDVDGNLRFRPGEGSPNSDLDALVAARDACSQYLEGVTLQRLGIDRTALEDSLYAYAECMREQGFDLPDPDLDNTLRRLLGRGEQNPQGGAGIGPFGDVDFEDPAFIAADEVCRPRVFATAPGGVPARPGS